MPNLIRPPDKKDSTAFLRMLYLRTEQRLVAEINRKRQAGYVDYAEVAALNRVQQILRDMVDECWAYVPKMVETIFYRSEAAANGYRNAAGLTITQRDIVDQLSNNLLGDIIEAADTAQKHIENVFRIGRLEEGRLREKSLKVVAQQQAMGSGTGKAAKELGRKLQEHDITAFVDKAGRKWSLQDYCNMVTRTTARQAEVSAILTADPDHDLYKIVKIGSTCPICAALEGRVYSRSGINPDYPALARAFGKIDPKGSDDLSNTYLNIHPNCLHSLVKYTTMGKTEKQIQRDKDFSSFEKNPATLDPRTKKQIAAYREKERNRQKLLRDIKQHKEYRAALGSEVPKDFARFQEHKQLGDERFKAWRKKYLVSRESISEVGEKLRLKLPDEIMSINGMTEDKRVEIEKTITTIQKKYNAQIGQVGIERFGKKESGTIMLAGPYESEDGTWKMALVINKNIDYNRIEERIAEQYQKGYFASKTLSDVVAHEMAHILTFQNCRTEKEYSMLREQVRKLYTKGVSGYADRTQDGAEMLAEAFVRIRNGEKVPLRVKMAVKKYVTRR